jgi:hypothetical protein
MHTVEYDNRDIVIRFPRAALDSHVLLRLLEWLSLEEIRHNSQLTQAQADELAQDVKQAAWRELQRYVR